MIVSVECDFSHSLISKVNKEKKKKSFWLKVRMRGGGENEEKEEEKEECVFFKRNGLPRQPE